MSEVVPTVRVVNDKAEGGYVVINKDDFDPGTHQVHESDPEMQSKGKPKMPTSAATTAASDAFGKETKEDQAREKSKAEASTAQQSKSEPSVASTAAKEQSKQEDKTPRIAPKH